MRKPVLSVLARSDTNQDVQPQKTARCFRFRKKGIYHLCSENEGADQLCGAQLTCASCFRIYKGRSKSNKTRVTAPFRKKDKR